MVIGSDQHLVFSADVCPAENGFVLTVSYSGLAKTYVFENLPDLCTFLHRLNFKTAPFPAVF